MRNTTTPQGSQQFTTIHPRVIPIYYKSTRADFLKCRYNSYITINHQSLHFLTTFKRIFGEKKRFGFVDLGNYSGPLLVVTWFFYNNCTQGRSQPGAPRRRLRRAVSWGTPAPYKCSARATQEQPALRAVACGGLLSWARQCRASAAQEPLKSSLPHSTVAVGGLLSLYKLVQRQWHASARQGAPVACQWRTRAGQCVPRHALNAPLGEADDALVWIFEMRRLSDARRWVGACCRIC